MDERPSENPKITFLTPHIPQIGSIAEKDSTERVMPPEVAEINKTEKEQADRLQPEEIPADNLQSHTEHAQEPARRDVWFLPKRFLTTETSRADSVRLAKWVLAAASLIGVAGMTWYFATEPTASHSQQVDGIAGGNSAPNLIKQDADPLRDLKVQRATIDKGRSDTTAVVWVVTIENKSTSYSYSNIQYETTYVGADNNPLQADQDLVVTTIAPGEQKNLEVIDRPLLGRIPLGATTWYKFRITGATGSTP